jgi:hypothetical protein
MPNAWEKVVAGKSGPFPTGYFKLAEPLTPAINLPAGIRSRLRGVCCFCRLSLTEFHRLL